MRGLEQNLGVPMRIVSSKRVETYQKYDIVEVDFGKKTSGDKDSHIQKGRRPCVIINTNPKSPVSIVIPLTTKVKNGGKNFHSKISFNKVIGLQKDSYTLCEQIVSIDNYKIKGKYGKLEDREEIKALHKAINFLMYN